LLWARRRVRFIDWLLFAILGTLSVTAVRNIIFMGFIGPVILAAYLPEWKRPVPLVWEYLATISIALVMGVKVASGSAFQLRMVDWGYPVGAADFLVAHRVTGPIFNVYEQGGYLMWRLWPQAKVFIDGRALNESVWQDYEQIGNNGDRPNGKTTEDLLQQYD